MLYQNVCIEGLGHSIPDEVVTTAWLEEQAAPAFEAVGANFGLIEKRIGVKERRWRPEDVRFTDAAAMAARDCLGNRVLVFAFRVTLGGRSASICGHLRHLRIVLFG